MLQLLDMHIPITPETTVTYDQEHAEVTYITVTGTELEPLRSLIEKAATHAGYALRRSERLSVLQRGERRMSVHVLGDSLGIRTIDDEVLPHSKFLDGQLVLGAVALPVPNKTLVTPGRERSRSSRERHARWTLRGATPDETARVIHSGILALGLHSDGVWEIPRGTPTRWKVEGSSSTRLVQVDLSETGGETVVEVVVVEGREART